MHKRPRIFIGFSEVANFINSYKQGFEALGYQTYTVANYRNKYYPDAQYDVVLSEIRGQNFISGRIFGRIWRSLHARVNVALVFLKALVTCDVFYYNTGGNVLPFRMDYWLIRALRKKLVVIFLGSEIRHWYLYKKEMEAKGYHEMFATCIEAYRNQKFNNYWDKKERVAAAERYANIILSFPGYAQLQSKPYMRANVGLYLPNYSFAIHGRIRPLIVHAPTARGIKGTEFVIEALNRLQLEGLQFDFKLIENLPNLELIKLLTEADIVVDELNSDAIGVLSTEAMATGNAVLTGYMADWGKVPESCPVVNTNRSNVYEHVKKLITDVECRVRLASAGRKYVELHHDIQSIAARELNFLYCNTTELQYDFIPSFDAIIPAAVLKEEKRRS